MATSNTPRPTKAERREAAREEARRLREEQAKREKRNRIILIGTIVAVLALIAVAAVVIIGQSQKSALDDVASPAGANESGGIVVGAEGVGSANDGAPTVQVYADFMCPYCGQFELTNGVMLEDLADAGQATVVYHPLAILDRFSNGTNYSTRAAQAAAVVADQAPEQFTAFYRALFENQPAENTDGLSDEEIASIAVGVGVPQAVADTFTEGVFNDWVAAATSQASDDGVTGTPTILIDGEAFTGDWRNTDDLRAAIVGDGAATAEPTGAATTEPTGAATAEPTATPAG